MDLGWRCRLWSDGGQGGTSDGFMYLISVAGETAKEKETTQI
jgi:hypothetical protein